MRATAPDGTSVVIVADGPSPEQAAALEALAAGEGAEAPDGAADRVPVEVVWTSERLGHAAATNIGLRRASGPVVDPPRHERRADRRPRDAPRPALDDPTVAVAGGWGIVSTDLRKFEDAPAGDVDAIEGYVMAFRRADAAARGPLDERFRFYRNLDIWWSLVLRDEGEGRPPRRAVGVDGCRPSGTSTAATRASSTTSATARASATSTGSSTGSAGAATSSSAADRGRCRRRARPRAARP